MSWNTLSPAHRETLEETLTRGQLDALILSLAGCSQRTIADMLGISRTTCRDRLRAANNAIASLTRKEAA